MKRRTRLIMIGCAIAGTSPAAAQAASATPMAGLEFGNPKSAPRATVSESPRLSESARLVKAAHASDAPRRVHAPVVRVTVKSRDTLTAIGARISRSWEQLASYNHLPNPNLIYPDQVLSIPPANYVPVALPVPAPVVETVAATETESAPAAPARSTYSAPVAQTYTAPAVQAPVASAAPAPSASVSGVWSCIAQHESGGNPATNTGNGFYGMFQDTQSSWVSGGGLAYASSASQASAAAQLIVNQRIQAQQGWGAWPVSSVACGV